MSLLCRSLSSSLSSSSSSLFRSSSSPLFRVSLSSFSPHRDLHSSTLSAAPSSSPHHHSSSINNEEGCYVWGQKGAFLNGLLPSTTLSNADLTAPQFAPSPNPHAPIRSLSVGRYHYAIVTEDGKVYTWGNGESGQLGHGKSEPAKTPTIIDSLPAAQSVSCGGYHTLILDRSGHVWSVGYGGKFFGLMAGGLGHGNWTSISTPKQVEGLKDIVAISAGNFSSYALAKDGTVYAWGRGEFGVLGTGGSGNEKTPVKLISLQSPVKAIRSGPFFNALISEKGELFMFGKNDQCQLGLGAGLSMDIYSMESVPSSVNFSEAQTALKENGLTDDNQLLDASCGTSHSIAVNKNGRCFYWGNRVAMVPRLIRGDNNSFLKEQIVACAAGHQYSLFADDKGHLFSMGEGISHCLGTGTKSNRSSPSLIPGFGPSLADFNPFGPVSRVFAGYTNAAVITATKKK